jgi:drug/metabolite transporter (DMT)-like permease
MPHSRDQLLDTVAAITAAALFGLLGPLARFAADAGVEGVAFTAWRAGLGACFLLVLIGVRGTARTSLDAARGLPRRGRLAFAIAALMGVTLNVAMFTAFGMISIALTLMLFYAYPAGVVVVDLVLGRERMTRSRLAALALSTLGVVLVLFGGMGGELSANPLGIALGLAAAACQVVFVTVSRHGYDAVPADAATLGILATAFAGASAIALVAGQGASLVVPLTSTEPWPYLLLGGVAAAGVSSLLFLSAIRMIGGTRTGILMLLEPVVGVVLAAVLLGEALLPLQALGGGLVLAGALVLQLGADPGLDPIEEAAAGPVV